MSSGDLAGVLGPPGAGQGMQEGPPQEGLLQKEQLPSVAGSPRAVTGAGQPAPDNVTAARIALRGKGECAERPAKDVAQRGASLG